LHVPFGVPGTITVTGSTRQTITVGADGRYTATLAPGTYRLNGESPNFGGHGCVRSRAISVASGRALQADLRCVRK
jgi:hypothetical protein